MGVMRGLAVLLALMVVVALSAGGRAAPAPAQGTPTPTPTDTATPVPTETPTPTETPSPTPEPTAQPAAPAPAPVADKPSGPPASMLLIPDLASDEFTSPRLKLRWRGRGADDARAQGFKVDVRPVTLRSQADWRALVAGAPQRQTVFTGAAGVTYQVRVAARDRPDSYGGFALDTITVPFDERDRHVLLAGRWQRVHAATAWQGTLARGAGRGAKATLRFSGRRLRVVARRSPGAGRLAVVLDGRRHTVSTAGSSAPRQVVFDAQGLRAGRHRVVVSPSGGRVELDAIAPS